MCASVAPVLSNWWASILICSIHEMTSMAHRCQMHQCHTHDMLTNYKALWRDCLHLENNTIFGDASAAGFFLSQCQWKFYALQIAVKSSSSTAAAGCPPAGLSLYHARAQLHRIRPNIMCAGDVLAAELVK